MSLRRPGPLALALGAIGLGVLTLAVRHFVLFWHPAPAWLPAPELLAVVSGVVLLAGGIGLFLPRTRKIAAWALMFFGLVWAIALSPVAFHHPARVDVWESLCEPLAVWVGIWLVAGPGATPLDSRATLLSARILFGACCVVFGVSHFAYTDYCAGMIPSWLPAHRVLVDVSGAGHAAAGIALLTGRWARLGVTLEAIMLGIFVVILHLPSLWATPAPAWAPTAAGRWSELLISLSVAGAAATLADALPVTSLRSRPAVARG